MFSALVASRSTDQSSPSAHCHMLFASPQSVEAGWCSFALHGSVAEAVLRRSPVPGSVTTVIREREEALEAKFRELVDSRRLELAKHAS